MKLGKVWRFWVLLWSAVMAVASCGGNSASNGTDSNTHWLKDCDQDADCGSLSCVCGVCSTPCDSTAACTAFGSDAVCEVPNSCGVATATTACVRPTAGDGGAGGGGAQTLDCEAMDARNGARTCDSLLGYAFDGVTCGPITCTCAGQDCGELFHDLDECDQAYAACASTYRGCTVNSECHLIPRGCCFECGAQERDSLMASYTRVQHGPRCTEPDGPFSCQECASSVSPAFETRCLEGQCRMVDVTPQAECQQDSDCQLVSKDCCSCPEDERNAFVAVNKLAGPPGFCGNADCVLCTHTPDLELGVRCNTEFGKCEKVTRPSHDCEPLDCQGLDEASCLARPALAGVDGCAPRYGAPWPDDSGEPQYAGCAQVCCLSDTACPGNIDAEVCAVNESAECWMLSAPPVPQGWTLLLEETCAEVPQCN